MTIARARQIALDQYTETEVAAGEAYANAQGFSTAEEWFALVMSKILYSADQLASGARYVVKAGTLSKNF